MLHHGTNQLGWKMFLRELKEHTDAQYIRPPVYILADNHSVHKAYGVRASYEGFKVLFTPPYSSDLNGVENLWAIFKAKLSKHVDRLPRELTQVDFEAEIDYICHSISEEMDIPKLPFAARDDLLRALD